MQNLVLGWHSSISSISLQAMCAKKHRFKSSHRSFKVRFHDDKVAFKTTFYAKRIIYGMLRFTAAKQSSRAKDTTDEICAVYGSGTTTSRIILNRFEKSRASVFDLKDEDHSGRSAISHFVYAINITRYMIIYSIRYEVWVPHQLMQTASPRAIYFFRDMKKYIFHEACQWRHGSDFISTCTSKTHQRCNENRPSTVAKPGLHPKKVLLRMDRKIVVQYKVLPQDETIKSAKYCNQLEKL
uniref:Mos1 transposase HTH domain-containing protein n=1 Tax=Glossina pallidipes TaxID=7398 RepID=A0A1A9ZXE8_GLOPL